MAVCCLSVEVECKSQLGINATLYKNHYKLPQKLYETGSMTDKSIVLIKDALRNVPSNFVRKSFQNNDSSD